MKKLLEIMRRKSVLHAPPDKPFVLKSGATSMTYIDVRKTALSPDGLYQLYLEMTETYLAMRLPTGPIRPKLVAGVALGGCPLATGMSLLSKTYDALYVRPEAKDHGAGNLVEGTFEPGQTVLLLEDVITTGGSTLKALAALRSVGLQPFAVVGVLDREQGGVDLINKECPCAAVMTMSQLLEGT